MTTALTLLIEQRLILEVAHLADLVDIRVLPPLCPLSVSSADFRHGAELIDRARAAAGRWLDEGGPLLPHPERFLALHRDDVPMDAAQLAAATAVLSSTQRETLP